MTERLNFPWQLPDGRERVAANPRPPALETCARHVRVEALGRVLVDTPAVPLSEENRAIDARNAFLMTSLLQEVTRAGTAARAQATLKRPDIYGKTGTTNDAMDAWFAGYQATTTAITWIGYDTPRKLGDRGRIGPADLDQLHGDCPA